MPKAHLVELYARELGAISEARLEFGQGFNVITGETGAGKTLLLEALGLCVGGDANGARLALRELTRVTALFTLDSARELFFSREVSVTGRLRSSLNGAPSSAPALQLLAKDLIVIHGQHDSLALRNRGEVLRLIDECGQVDTAELEKVRRSLEDARSRRRSAGGDSGAREREMEYLAHQMSEIKAARVRSADELDRVIDELTRLTTLRDGQAALSEVLATLDGESDDAVLTQFARSLTRLPVEHLYDPIRAALRGALVQSREALRELASLIESDAFDPEVLRSLEERASVLQMVARKYGGTLEAALSSYDELSSRYAQMSGEIELLQGLDEEILALEETEPLLARRVRGERERAAARLGEAVCAQFPRVALAKASLRFDIGGVDGSDAQILFTPNPGFPEGPLATLASGGELSRVLLALSLERANEHVVAVFDEVDAGLGGQVAQEIGECLQELGQRQQVLAVTHLASVAARADSHFSIEKCLDNGVTRMTIRELRGSERTLEIARMLAGDHVTLESSALAQQLLESSRQERAQPDLSR